MNELYVINASIIYRVVFIFIPWAVLSFRDFLNDTSVAKKIKTINNKYIYCSIKEKEILLLKGNLHDSMSQRLSILHCYIIENKGEDIKQIKNLMYFLGYPKKFFSLKNFFSEGVTCR